jgi:hypothetical protein
MTTITRPLALGTTEAESADIVVEDGSAVTISVVGEGPEMGYGMIYLRKKTTTGYGPKGPPSEVLDNYRVSAGLVQGPVTFRLYRPACKASVGAELERS